jgi:DNA polymerase-3 subunit epsilon
LPPLLETPLSDIPDTPGVYLFFGEGPLPLYVGKSINLRTRVLSHFQSSAKVAREMRILTEIRRVEWRETAGELGALLLESRLVKEMQPVYNRQLRRERNLSAWRLNDDPTQGSLVQLVRVDEIEPGKLGDLFGAYRSKRQATDALRAAADLHALCPQALGLEPGKGACFSHQIGKCKGVCAGRENPALHLLRLKLALGQQRLQAWPHAGKVGIREHHAATGRSDIHVFDQWCHLATVHNESELEDATSSRQPLAFDLDTYRLLLKRLAAPLGHRADVFLIREAHHAE